MTAGSGHGVDGLPGGSVASLPMYDWPEVRDATDAHWVVIARHLRASGFDAPEALDRAGAHDAAWSDPALLLSQTCGWPFATRLHASLVPVGTPIYAVEGCDGPLYRSAVVVPAGSRATGLADLEGARLAINSEDSLSGWATFRAALDRAGVDVDRSPRIPTGSHRASLHGVATGEADAAAIDAVCLALARRYEPEAAASVKVIAWTSALPGLPLVTRRRPDGEIAAIRAALAAAFADPAGADARRALMINGIGAVEAAAYLGIPDRLAAA